MSKEYLMNSKMGEGGELEFLEEVSNINFVTYTDLSASVNITTGNLINEGGGWLKYKFNNKVCYVAKKNIRNNISWDYLNTLGLVFGEKKIDINGQLFKIRLLMGSDTDPTPLKNGTYLNGTHNSEWSKLFYPIVKDDANIPIPPRNLNAVYTNSELNLNAIYSWCSEKIIGDATWVSRRGYFNASYKSYTNSYQSGTTTGWRPVLELIP